MSAQRTTATSPKTVFISISHPFVESKTPQGTLHKAVTAVRQLCRTQTDAEMHGPACMIVICPKVLRAFFAYDGATASQRVEHLI